MPTCADCRLLCARVARPLQNSKRPTSRAARRDRDHYREDSTARALNRRKRPALPVLALLARPYRGSYRAIRTCRSVESSSDELERARDEKERCDERWLHAPFFLPCRFAHSCPCPCPASTHFTSRASSRYVGFPPSFKLRFSFLLSHTHSSPPSSFFFSYPISRRVFVYRPRTCHAKNNLDHTAQQSRLP